MTNLIAEDLVLLLLDDETGKLEHATYLDAGIGGALLVELALAENVSVVRGSGFWARAKVHVSSAPPPADPVLAEALALAHKVVDREGLPAREIKKRAKEIAEGDWSAKAVSSAGVRASLVSPSPGLVNLTMHGIGSADAFSSAARPRARIAGVLIPFRCASVASSPLSRRASSADASQQAIAATAGSADRVS